MDLVKELNAKYEFGLERAPCQHLTPSFIDGHLQRWLYRLLKDRMEARLLTARVKKVAQDTAWHGDYVRGLTNNNAGERGDL